MHGFVRDLLRQLSSALGGLSLQVSAVIEVEQWSVDLGGLRLVDADKHEPYPASSLHRCCSSPRLPSNAACPSYPSATEACLVQDER